MVDVVVDHGGEEIVRQPDRAEVAGEVQVDVLHRDHLGIAAAGGAALHAEHGAQRGLAQADDRLLADLAEGVAEAHRGRGLALARGRGADRGHEDQLAVGLRLQRLDVVERNLGLVMAERRDRGIGNAQLQGDFPDGFHLGVLGDLDIARNGLRLRLAGDCAQHGVSFRTEGKYRKRGAPWALTRVKSQAPRRRADQRGRACLRRGVPKNSRIRNSSR